MTARTTPLCTMLTLASWPLLIICPRGSYPLRRFQTKFTYAGVERGSINGMGYHGAPYLLVHHNQLGLLSFQLPWITSLVRSQSQRQQATSCISADCLQTQHGTQ